MEKGKKKYLMNRSKSSINLSGDKTEVEKKNLKKVQDIQDIIKKLQLKKYYDTKIKGKGKNKEERYNKRMEKLSIDDVYKHYKHKENKESDENIKHIAIKEDAIINEYIKNKN